MRRMFSGLQRRVTSPFNSQDSSSPSSSSGIDSPEATIAREIKAFCESGSGSGQTSNDYLHLPAIVEAAESSAGAAKEAAVQIRKYLSGPSKVPPGIQYNSIMLIRILSENPGHTFTRNFDNKFVNTIRDLLREGRDMPAQHMLRETLDTFETQKSWDEDLAAMIAMWKKEKERAVKYTRSPPPNRANPQAQQPGFAPAPRRRQLPPPQELASRIAEAKTSANLLIQLAQSTPAAEVQSHELMREFFHRCQSAFKSIQGYMSVEDPPPDENTMLTLIETNEQVSVALSKYQRAVLNARKTLGTLTPVNSNGGGSPPVNGQVNGSVTNGNVNPVGGDIASGSTLKSESTSLPAPVAISSNIPPSLSSLQEPFSPTELISFDTPADSPPPVPTTATATKEASGTPLSELPAPTTTTTTTSRRYEYNADEFNVENPFADNAAEDDPGHEPTRRVV